MPLPRMASINARSEIQKEKIRLAIISPKRMSCQASQAHCNIGKVAVGNPADGERYGPRCAEPYSTGRSVSVVQRQLPSLAFWNANDFSIVSR